MGKILQAKCPYCKKVLRIPDQWLRQPMRCKYCQKIFQAKGNSAPAASPGAVANKSAAPVAKPVHRARSSVQVFGVIVGLFLVLIAAAALIIAGPQLMELAESKKAAKKAGAQIAKADTKKDNSANTPKTDAKKKDAAKKKDDTKKKDAAKKNKKTEVTPQPKTKKNGKRVENKQPKTKTVKPKVKAKPKPPPPVVRPRPPIVAKGAYPRRALAISINDYLLANPLNYGKERAGVFPGSSTDAVLYWFGHFRMKFPKSQLLELSDYSIDGDAPLKPVMTATIDEFLKTSRPQDRIVLLFSGHVKEGDDQAYLVPIEGDPSDIKTLIPINWMYAKLSDCPARQKVLIVDGCRYDPGRGMEREGSDPMGEILEKQLMNPPVGVQVWSSCSLDQQSYEFENGSLFMEALCRAMGERLDGIQTQEDAIPLDQLHKRVNQFIATRLEGSKLKQITFISGSEPATGAAYDPSEPLPARLKVVSAMATGGYAGRAVVKSILDELNAAPPPRSNRKGSFGSLRYGALPPFPSKALEEFKSDGYTSEMEFLKQKDQQPLRAAIVHAKAEMRKYASAFRMKEYFDGNTSAAVKTQVLKELEKPGKCILFLEDALEELNNAEKHLKDETSKRWKAHYYYVLARVKSRLLYLLEYQTVLAKIRTEDLPALGKGETGYRLSSRRKLSSREDKSRAWRTEVRDLWDQLINQYPSTPWSIMARRERGTNLGLVWMPTRK